MTKQKYPIGYIRTGSDGIKERYEGGGVWSEVNPELKLRRAKKNKQKNRKSISIDV